jgi:pimeloyl-ACP methyl ester carboxylesterase
MGGTVSLAVAIQHPARVCKVTVIGSPIEGSSLSILLKLFGHRNIAWLVYNNMWAFRMSYYALAPFYTRDRRWPKMMDRDLSRVSLESFLLSIASLRMTDLRQQIQQIQIPAMGMYGAHDIIVNPNQWKPLQSGITHARIERFSNAGHFIMLDAPDRFMTTLLDFLDHEASPA